MSSSSSLVISDPSSRPPSLAAEPAPWNSLLTPHTTALSYIDREADDPKWRSRVAAEIAAETKRDPSFRAEVDQKIEKTLGPSYDWNHSTTRLSQNTRSDLEKLVNGQDLERDSLFDNSKFSVPSPDAGTDASAEEWHGALNNARVQLAAQQVRSDNISLLKSYGANAWRLHAFGLETDAKRAEVELERLQQETNALNRTRRGAQIAASDVHPSAKHRLEQSNAKWSALVSNTLQISVANVAAEREIEQLQAKRRRLSIQSSS